MATTRRTAKAAMETMAMVAAMVVVVKDLLGAEPRRQEPSSRHVSCRLATPPLCSPTTAGQTGVGGRLPPGNDTPSAIPDTAVTSQP